MKKSELKKRILEALTPDEASKVDAKYKEIYAGMVGKNPLKMKKYDNPDKVAYGRAINLIQKESAKLAEKKLTSAEKNKKEDIIMSMKDQKGGKDKLKPADYAAATATAIKVAEEIENSTFERHADRVEDLLRQLIKATKSVDSSQDDTEDDVEELDQSIDYLAAAITDKDPIDIALDQDIYGRLAKPTKEEKTLEEIDAIMEKSAHEAEPLSPLNEKRMSIPNDVKSQIDDFLNTIESNKKEILRRNETYLGDIKYNEVGSDKPQSAKVVAANTGGGLIASFTSRYDIKDGKGEIDINRNPIDRSKTLDPNQKGQVVINIGHPLVMAGMTFPSIVKDATGISVYEAIKDVLYHEAIHALDPTSNTYRKKDWGKTYDTRDNKKYYSDLGEFKAFTDSFQEKIIDRVKSMMSSSRPAPYQVEQFLQYILDYFSGKIKEIPQPIVNFLYDMSKEGIFKKLARKALAFAALGGYNIADVDDPTEQFMRIRLIKKYNPTEYKRFLKNIYLTVKEGEGIVNSWIKKYSTQTGKKYKLISVGGKGKLKEDAKDKSEKNYSNYFKKMDNMMEESAYEAGRLEKKVKAILKKEGGAVGLKPLVDAAKELGATKKDLMSILKRMKDVKTHKDGDIIDTGGLNETGQEIAKKNMDMYKDKNRLEELVKAALMKETSTDKYDDNPALKGKQSDLPDGLQKAIIKKSGGKVDEYASLARYDKDGNKTVTTIDDIDILPRHKRLQHEMAFKDFLTTLKALGYDIPEGTLPMEENIDESFDSLVKKVDKSKGYTKKEAEKVAGSIAAKKRAGAGKGPTAKQKKRMAETILKELRG